ncbi:MAG: aminotransferase class I/II-fold pyridoxal phosphate-dependent enzyme [Eubacteriales bacterium]|jgi:cystathionine beta-lyase family protein involved in aluminum resistance|nr:hypothetical protein [Clostridiales bacterium]
MNQNNFPSLEKIDRGALSALREQFDKVDAVSATVTKRVLDAFREERVSESMFAITSGYGYDDRGRDALERVWAHVFGAEAALVRHTIVSGTHAIAIGLYGLLRPGDVLLSLTGKPYDTLDEVIGMSGEPGNGSLRDFGIEYREVELGEDFAEALSDPHVKVAFFQRSKGYSSRRTLSAAELTALTRRVKELRPDVFTVIDNCYGEFVCETEPEADLVIGSLIKNPGGGVAETGGYLAGTRRAVELAGYRLTSPGIGAEVGPGLVHTKSLFRGLFFAPHTVAQAVKTAIYAAYVFEALGFEVEPHYSEPRYDIIQTVRLGSPDALCAFCRGIQAGSPIDAFVTPEPWDMPGYSDQVIMAAGTFVQGGSLELSADGPLRPPYTAFLQGGLTFESGRIGVLSAARAVIESMK